MSSPAFAGPTSVFVPGFYFQMAVIAGEAKQSIAPQVERWIAHMGNVCVKDEGSPFCSTAATSSSRPRAVQDGARRSSQGRPVRAAAQRLDLELSEHVI